MLRNISIFILIVVVAAILNCENTVDPYEPIDCEDRDRNALLMDLYLTNDVFPSYDYYYKIYRDLKMIEYLYGNTYPRIPDIKFRFPFVYNELLIQFDEETKQLINSGQYHAWDEYNSLFRLDTLIEKSYYQLRFKCCPHMLYLQRNYYSNLPGVNWVCKNTTNYPETNLIPRVFGDTLSYLYQYGECGWPGMGCEYYEYYYFRFVRRELDLVGAWSTNSGEPRPEWYNEAITNDWEFYNLFYK